MPLPLSILFYYYNYTNYILSIKEEDYFLSNIKLCARFKRDYMEDVYKYMDELVLRVSSIDLWVGSEFFFNSGR